MALKKVSLKIILIHLEKKRKQTIKRKNKPRKN